MLVALVALPAMITVPFVGVGLYLTSGRNNEPRAALTLQDGTALRLSAPGTRLDVVDGGYVRMRRQLASEAVSGSSDEDSASSSSPGSLGSDHHSSTIAAAPLLAAFGTLAAGAAIMHLFSSFGVPYTAILLIEGMLLGVVLFYSEESADPETNLFVPAMATWAKLDAHMMLNLFLPPLIFESAFATEWRVFNQCKSYCAFLAMPCMLAATYATGHLANVLLMPRDPQRSYKLPQSVTGGEDAPLGTCAADAWSTEAGLTLGVVLSATDPVAVVALLKDLGLGGLLSVSIEGESLLNDGTALVVFNILVKTLTDAQSYGGPNYQPADHWMTPAQVVVQFLLGSAIGALFGAGMGMTLTAWLSFVYNDAMVEVSLTLSFAYLTFFLAESLGSSGVLAVVALGLWMSRNGRTQISPHVEEFLNEFWEMLAYFGNTLIFVITGIIVVYDVMNSESPVNLAVDLPHLLAIYAGCTFIRYDAGLHVHTYNNAVFSFPAACTSTALPHRCRIIPIPVPSSDRRRLLHPFPPSACLVTIAYALNNTFASSKLEWKWALITTWGGLRGAVGLALGMIVFKEPSICPNIKTRVMFHTAGMVILTVVINATSMPRLVSLLGMARMAPSKRVIFMQALRAIEAAGTQREKVAMKEGVFGSTVWEEARTYYVKVGDLQSREEAKQSAAEKRRAVTAGGGLVGLGLMGGLGGGSFTLLSGGGGKRGQGNQTTGKRKLWSKPTAAPNTPATAESCMQSTTITPSTTTASASPPTATTATTGSTCDNASISTPMPLPRRALTLRRRASHRASRYASRLRLERPVSRGASLEAELRRRILLMCKRSYWNQLEEGMIGRDAVKFLRQLSDAALRSVSVL